MRTSRLQPLLYLRYELDRYALYAATAAFTLIAAAVATRDMDIPGGLITLSVYPIALFAAAWLRPHSVIQGELRGAAAWSVLVIAAFVAVPRLTTSPLIALGLPVAIGAGIAAARRPAATVVVALFLTGIGGTFQAYLGFPASPLTDLALTAIWLVVLARVVLGRPYAFAAWPAILGCCLYFGLTAIDMVTSDELGIAWHGFRTTVWYMVAFLALAYAGWPRATYRRIALGFVAVTVLIAGYATLRWATGPSGPEATLAQISGNGINVDPIDKHLRTVGSFLTGHQLAFWTAFMAPFCAAIALWARGRWRVLAIVGVILCVSAMVASEARGPLPGFVAGLALVLVLYQFSRAFTGLKIGVVALAIGAIAALSGGVLALGASDPDRLERYERILEPESDPTFIQRQLKWEQVLNAIEEQPFGHGLGTGGTGAGSREFVDIVATANIDNSYLKIAYEQGMVVMVLFVAAIVALLASIIVASIRTTSREGAAFGFGAAGALLSMLISFYTGLYIESIAVLAGWLVVGLGLSHFVTRELPAAAPEPARAEKPRDPRRVGAMGWATMRAR